MLKTNPVHRPVYESLLESYRDTADVKVLTGVRRCGKSTLLAMLADSFKRLVPEQNVFYRRMDAFGVPLNPNAEWLEGEIVAAIARSDESQPFYVLLDEIQDVENWEKVIRRLHTRPHTDVYITGSNAYVLSSDLSTLLSGRYVELKIHPLSFAEFCDFASGAQGMPNASDELFAEYMRYGGMPGQFDVPKRDREHLARFLEAVSDTIILKDVAMRTQIGDMDLLSKLVRYAFSTSGNLFSTRNIVNALTSSGRKTSSETIDNYLGALKNAFIVDECEQEGIAGKQVLRPLRKFYPVDTGLRNLTTNFATKDIGSQLECVVFNELKRRGRSVTVGALAKGEVDFVADLNGAKEYFQVTESLVAPEVYEREIRPFDAIGDSFPKTVLTLDRYRTGITEKGVSIVNVIDWLMDNKG